MEWLKAILEKAEIKDGNLDVEALMSTINVEAPKNIIPKAEYNNVSKQLKEANDTIKDLKKNNAENEELQKKIKEHEDTIKTLQTNAANDRKEFDLKNKLKDLGVTDVDYLIYKHGGIDKFNYDKEGNVIGLEDTIKPYKESISHIFTPKIEGRDPFNKTTSNKGMTKEEFNSLGYKERVELYNNNKELYDSFVNEE